MTPPPAPPQDAVLEAEPASANPSVSARSIALRLLGLVLRKRRALDEALASKEVASALDGLETRDRAFVRAMVATTLRRLGQIDAALDGFMDHPLPREAAPVQDGLRLGAAQLLFMDVPDHAAVDEAVSLTAQERYRPLVNAVLRKVAAEGKAILARQDAPRLNTPDWLWESWASAYGISAVRAIAEQHLLEPPLDLWAPRFREAWARRLKANVLPTGTLRRPLTDVRGLMGFSHGAWWVQDAAASLPARLLKDVEGQTVVDLCAAPGGKTMQLAARGARVIAVDRSAKRLARVEENLKRVRLEAELVEHDATTWVPAEKASHILLDAPCSATGTIRRHPDIVHLKSAEDVEKLVVLQDRLLAHAAEQLAPGGTLVYCTCSLQPEEGPERIDRLLEDRADLKRVPIALGEIDGFEEAISRHGDMRTLPCVWPERGGMDGFYAARLTKIDV